jgi:hypothetical protein
LLALIAGGFYLFKNLTASPVSSAKLAEKYNQAPEIKQKYKLDNAALKMEPKDKNSAGIILGDANSKEFVPNLEINRWDSEVKFKLKPDISDIPDSEKKVTIDGDKINYETPEVTYQFYSQPDGSEDGGYEFSEILKTKPQTNVFTTPIETANLDFFYQAPLANLNPDGSTWEDNGHGGKMIRPENISGSYAVYYRGGKSGDYTQMGGKNYQAGKAFHIYRPQVIDAQGNKVWGEFNRDVQETKVLSVIVPQDFLDKAVYPVTVDPTFGYAAGSTPATDLGASDGTDVAANIYATSLKTAVTGDTITSFSIYGKMTSGTGAPSLAAYSMSSGLPNARLATAVTATFTTTAGWRTSGTVSQAMSNGVQYCVASRAVSGAHFYVDDAGSGNQSSYRSATSLPATWVHDSYLTFKFGIYATYTAPVASAAITGTITSSATEADIVSGGETIIITLTNDTWVTAGTAFDAQRQNIINGLDSAQSETYGWDAEVKAKIAVTDVVRTSNTVATITLDAEAAYSITANETITVTVPATAVAGGAQIVATPTFTITAIESAAITGTITSSATEANIVSGSETIIITLSGEAWVASGATFDGQRQNIINGLDSAQSETYGWDAEVKAKIAVTDVVRTSATIVTITLDAEAAYDTTVNETITVTIPATAVVGNAQIVATPTFTITAAVNNVYYSVGQNTASLLAGTSVTVTLSSGAATLNVAQSNNIGVGDYIEYGTAPYVKAYISAKTNADQKHWSVVAAAGGIPANVTNAPVNSIKHTFSTLAGAIAGADGAGFINNPDLTAANVILNIPCYYDSDADGTAVAVSGYTTDEARYIKIYTPHDTSTEANFSQRASGQWDETKYELYVATNNSNIIDISIDNVRIEGLQIRSVSTTGYASYAINTGSDNIEISDNLIRYSGSGNTDYIGISLANYCSNARIFNNIIYGFRDGINIGAWDTGFSGTLYLYNNTIVNASHIGITGSFYSQTYAKNNIVQNSDVGYSGTFDSSSDYNISDNADTPGSPGSHNKDSATVSFISTVSNSEDYHLSPADTAAKNSGADLSGDTLPITTDIDGQTRPTGANIVDIGADEGATAIYYSVGQNTSDHKTLGAGGSSPTITLSGYAATLSVGQTAPNMGVGDLITYTGGSCFISGKTSTTVWNCQNATGGTAAQVSGVTVTSIAHTFSSLSQAIGTSGSAPDSTHLNTSNLQTGNYTLNVPCYNDAGAADSTAVTIQNYTTAARNYIKVYTPNNTTSEVNQSQRHQGKWDDGKYRLEVSNATAINDYVNYIQITGLQIKISTASATYKNGMDFGNVDTGSGGEIIVSNNIIKGNYSGTSTDGMGIKSYNAAANPTFKIYNNIVYDFVNGASGGFMGIYVYNSTVLNAYVYNNTVNNCYTGYYRSGGIANVFAKNNIAQNTTTGYSGTFDNSSDYNISDHADAPGSPGTHNKNSTTVSFIDAANSDFHLTGGDTAAKNAGVTLATDAYLPFTTDIDGDTRPAETGKWDIGADEINSASSGTPGAVNINRNVNFGRNVNFK